MSTPDTFSSAFQLPDFWNDDARMEPLFALPLNESLNPDDWARLYEFWGKMILKWAALNRKLMFNVEDLKKVFCRNGKYPASLNRVLDEMEKNGDIVMNNKFCYQATTDSSLFGLFVNSYITPYFTSAISWIWELVTSYFPRKTPDTPSFVVPSVLKLTQLKQTEKFLNNEIDGMESEMMELKKKARTLLKEDSREAAKDALRQRKLKEFVCNQRKQVLSKTANEIQVIQEAYKIELSESNDLSSDSPMKEENILYAELNTELEQQEEICNILSQITVQDEESEFEEELKAIVAESARK